jgi:8-oxo-dGTP pyrophosphatase MutT (NUDIX family)
MSDDELVSLFSAEGQPMGARKRADAHRDGERVGLVFVWAAWDAADGSCRILLQTRARPGDPYLGSLDAPAGGHVQAGETHRACAVREFAEEVGLCLGDDELVYLGKMLLDNAAGPCRSAVQFFYLCRRPLSLEEVAFNEEVSAFVETDLEDFAALVQGRAVSIQGQARFAQAPEAIRAQEIAAEALAGYPEPIMEAFRRSMRAIRAYLRTGAVQEGIWTA